MEIITTDTVSQNRRIGNGGYGHQVEFRREIIDFLFLSKIVQTKAQKQTHTHTEATHRRIISNNMNVMKLNPVALIIRVNVYLFVSSRVDKS